MMSDLSTRTAAIEETQRPRAADRRRSAASQSRTTSSREQLAKIAANEPEEQRRDPRLRAATKAASYKRQSEVDAANAVPADLMTDDEIEAARTALLSAPNEELKQHIVNRTRAPIRANVFVLCAANAPIYLVRFVGPFTPDETNLRTSFFAGTARCPRHGRAANGTSDCPPSRSWHRAPRVCPF
jgi:hypothetical protein